MRLVAATKYCCRDKDLVDFHKSYPVHSKRYGAATRCVPKRGAAAIVA